MTVLGSVYELPETFFQGLSCPAETAQAVGLTASATSTTDDDRGGNAASTNASDTRGPAAAAGAASAKASLQPGAPATSGCIACGVKAEAFGSQEEQRSHFRSDWHRKNVKRRNGGRVPLTENEFEDLIGRQDDEVSSISGSSSSEDEDSNAETQRQQGTGRSAGTPRVHFIASDGQRVGMWRCLLTSGDTSDVDPAAAAAAALQLRKQPPKWAVAVSSGGHFAAAVFSTQPADSTGGARQQPKAQWGQLEAVAHKTFHRYVVRAKAGGRQSTQDNTGKFAKSAGSQIRRENEALLTADIKATLNEQLALLGPDDLIFIQASGANGAAIFGGTGAPLSRKDPRVRRIPFPTRRPTFAEAKRVVRLLSSVFVEDAPRVAEARAAAAAAPIAPPPVESGTQQAASSAGAGAEEADVLEAAPAPRLHRAAASGDADKVHFLLTSGHDPAEKDARGRPPYLVASNKPVRDAFRRFMAAQPDAWDYTAAGIPSALTDEMERHQEARAAEKKARQKAKEKERKKGMAEKKARQAEEARAAAAAEVAAAAAAADAAASRIAGVRSGARAPTPSQRQATVKQQQVDRQAAEVTARRERAAAAAEARMKALTLASQQQQLHC